MRASTGGTTSANGGSRAFGGSTSLGGLTAEGGASEAEGGSAASDGGALNSGGAPNSSGGATAGGASTMGGAGTTAGATAGGATNSGGTTATGGASNDCEPGAKLCEDNDIYQCNPDGTGTTLLEHCLDVIESCDPTAFRCIQRVCTPNVSRCDVTTLMTCNATGTAFEYKDCADEGKICIDNECRTPVCKPSTRFCEGDTLFDCNSRGTDKASVLDCTRQSSRCVQEGASASCVCTPGALDCSGNSIATCSSDGKNWVPTEACPDGKLCRGGACLTQTCPLSFPGFYCSGREIRQCIDGIDSALSATCGEHYSCFVGDGVLGCLRSPCDSGMPSCLMNQFGTCGPSGDTLSPVSDDCAARGLVCTTAGCAASALDVLGSPDEARHFESGLVGDFLSLSTDGNPFADTSKAARTLTRIEAYLRVTGSAEAIWEVWEWSPNWSFPTVELSQTTTVSGTGYQDSGPLNFHLDPRNDYIVTVRLNGSFDAFESAHTEVTLTSFGQLHEAVVGPYLGDWDGDPDHVFAFRVTTTPASQ